MAFSFLYSCNLMCVLPFLLYYIILHKYWPVSWCRLPNDYPAVASTLIYLSYSHTAQSWRRWNEQQITLSIYILNFKSIFLARNHHLVNKKPRAFSFKSLNIFFFISNSIYWAPYLKEVIIGWICPYSSSPLKNQGCPL